MLVLQVCQSFKRSPVLTTPIFTSIWVLIQKLVQLLLQHIYSFPQFVSLYVVLFLEVYQLKFQIGGLWVSRFLHHRQLSIVNVFFPVCRIHARIVEVLAIQIHWFARVHELSVILLTFLQSLFGLFVFFKVFKIFLSFGVEFSGHHGQLTLQLSQICVLFVNLLVE